MSTGRLGLEWCVTSYTPYGIEWLKLDLVDMNVHPTGDLIFW
jgi:hypothetical protein